jgi:bifunctional enzyme CysN/CysC
VSTALQEEMPRLGFLTCGGVGAGKSTLISRIFSDSKPLPEDRKTQRGQRTGIDVEYRLFATSKRIFAVLDTPDDEQKIRDMAIGASNSELAVILVDGHKGMLTQTRRDAYIASLLGIRNVVLAVNKMDLIDYSQDIFNKNCREFFDFATQLNFKQIVPIPVSAGNGDNVVRRSERTPWYDGPSLLTYLEDIEATAELESCPFRMLVQESGHSKLGTRRVSGMIVGGQIAKGDPVALAHSGRVSVVKQIIAAADEVAKAKAGQSISIILNEEIDISPGHVLADPKARPQYADQFAAHLLWMDEAELLPHRQYQINIGAQMVPAHVSLLKHKVDASSLERLAARTLQLNEVGYCNFSTVVPIAFDPYSENRDMGLFIVIDGLTSKTVGIGMIEFGLRRATNVHWQALDVNADARAELKHQKPCILWFTGLSGSGKSTIANLVEKRLFAQGGHTYILDGDNVRHGLSQDLGFTDADRVENIRRVAEAANLLVDAGLIVLVSFISPFRSERRLARDLAKDVAFTEIFVDTPVEVCALRDPKGLYKRAQAGEIKNFTGIDSPYEPPENPDIVLKTENVSPEELAELVLKYLLEKGLVSNI